MILETKLVRKPVIERERVEEAFIEPVKTLMEVSIIFLALLTNSL